MYELHITAEAYRLLELSEPVLRDGPLQGLRTFLRISDVTSMFANLCRVGSIVNYS